MPKSISLLDLPPQQQALLRTAKAASQNAYAPYSKFHVGAAILTEDGQIYVGQNQENAAYPACMCAERVALYHRCARTSSPILQVAIYAENTKARSGQKVPAPAAPCGECRQVLLEYHHRQDQPFKILCMNSKNEVIQFDDIQELLPHGFGAAYL